MEGENRVIGVVRAHDATIVEDDDWRKRQPRDELSELVSAAATGDSDAWRAIFGRFTNMVSAIARGCRLNDADIAEVHQVTWLRMVENIGRIEQPERIGAWLATTAKRESLRVVRNKGRVTFDHEGLLQRADTRSAPVDSGPIEEERALAVRKAFELLPPHCQRLLSLMSNGDETPSYKEISRALSMPIGSIGPTRGRCLEHLRRIMHELEAGTQAAHREDGHDRAPLRQRPFIRSDVAAGPSAALERDHG